MLVDVAHSLREAFFMFWVTLWALILGFGISGAVQAFVPRVEMERVLGRRGPREIGRATLFGAASSSCSYAASAMAKTLFQRGADFISSMVFMFASTNLVHGPASTRRRWRERLRSPAGWADAASYAFADAKMLRKEMAAGYLVAGFLAVLVPVSVWNDVFVPGHGFWTSLQNVIVGPFIALIACVCSIGNVPLAAALWHGGINFGGVMSFIFADLIALPLLFIYRRYYGGRLALKLLVTFWAVMSAAGLAVEYLFLGVGIVPETRPATVVPTEFSWNYTTFLNIVFLLLLAGLWWLARNQQRLGGGAGYAIDPVCGMQVEVANAPARSERDGQAVYFCSDHCLHRFEAEQAAEVRV